MTRIPSGTQVRLPDGTLALAYHDGNDVYRTAQESGHGGTRVDLGWRRDMLDVVGEAAQS